MTLLGQFALWTALVLGVWCVALSLSGRWQGRPEVSAAVVRSIYAIFGCLVVASVALMKGLISHDFNMEYVWAYTSRNLPSAYVFSALWAGQKGYLLPGALILSAGAALVLFIGRRKEAVAQAASGANSPSPVTATDEELERLKRELADVDG